MNNLYHLCLTAHDEVLIRNEEDARQIINLSALASYRTGTVIMTDAEMSTHLHQNICTTKPGEYCFSLLDSVTKDFNRRHHRAGRLFDKNAFILQLEGPNHIQMSLCYGLRQGVHHGTAQTAFEYQWCNANAIFAQERGYSAEDVSQMLQNEGNAKYNHKRKSDMEICKLIDTELLGKYHVQSVYELDVAQKLRIIDELRYDTKCSNLQQLARCVALKY